MPKKQEEKLLFGKSLKEIRSAYFKGKIPALLTEISAEGEPDEAGLMELAGYLESLKNEEKKTLSTLRENAPSVTVFDEDGSKVKLPTFENSRTPEEVEKVERFMNAAEEAVQFAKNIMFSVHNLGKQKAKIPADDWLDYGLDIAGVLHLIDGYRVFKDQAYRNELTRIIAEMGCSRKEAEEWAKVTDAYAEYKRAVLFKQQIEEFIMLTKKKAGINS